jgi:threonine dehydratase
MFQKSGSFKGRGVSHFCNQVVKAYMQGDGGAHLDTYGISTKAASADMNEWPWPVDISSYPKEKLPHLVIASAGNAGLAAASSSRILGVKCTIFVPDAQANIVGKFEKHNTNGNVTVVVGGVNYAAAALAAKAYVKSLGERG